jgi:hypothetical protein
VAIAATPAPPPQAAAEPRQSRRTVGYVVGALSLATLGMGSFFGFRALSLASDVDAQCAGGCSPEAVALNDDAKTAARIADVAIGAGLVGAGVSIYLLLSSRSGDDRPPAHAARDRLRLEPRLGPRSAGLVLGGAF